MENMHISNNPGAGTSSLWHQDQQEQVQMRALAGEEAHRLLFALKPRLLETRYLIGRVWHCCLVMIENNVEGSERSRQKINRAVDFLAQIAEKHERALEPYDRAFFDRYEKPRLFSIAPFPDALMDFYQAGHAMADLAQTRIKPLMCEKEMPFYSSVAQQGLLVIHDHLGRIRHNGAHLAKALPVQMKMGREDTVFGLRKGLCSIEGGPA